MMDQNNRTDRKPLEIFATLASVFQRSVRKQLLIYLVACMLVDLAVLAICPWLGGYCMYGFFTLVTYPVMFSGVLGVLLARMARRHCKRWGAILSIFATGAVVLGVIVVAAHTVAVGVLNAQSYGGVFVETRLLSVELTLAMIYYVPLSVIVYAKADVGHE